MEDKSLIHNDEIENSVIGVLITEQNSLNSVGSLLNEDCFYNNNNRAIFQAIKKLHEEGKSKTPFTVSEYVKSMFPDSNIEPWTIADLASKAQYTGFVEHASILAELSRRRKLNLLGMMLQRESQGSDKTSDELLSSASEYLEEVQKGAARNVYTLGDVVNIIYGKIKNNLEKDGPSEQTLTGFSFLDSRGGFRPTDLVVVAGETSSGKTCFANSITLSAIINDKKVACYSMEMSKEQMVGRLYTILKSINSNRILYEKLSSYDISMIDEATSFLMSKGNNIIFDDRANNDIDTIISSIHSMKAQYDIDGVIVDYLQILGSNMKTSNAEHLMGECARRLKNVAKQLGIWVLALSQLNRGGIGSNPVPELGRIRESGQIAEAADTVILIYRPEMRGLNYPEPYEQVNPHGTALIKVAKGRNIGTGDFICGFDQDRLYYHELDYIPTLGEMVRDEVEAEENDNAIPF